MKTGTFSVIHEHFFNLQTKFEICEQISNGNIFQSREIFLKTQTLYKILRTFYKTPEQNLKYVNKFLKWEHFTKLTNKNFKHEHFLKNANKF